MRLRRLPHRSCRAFCLAGNLMRLSLGALAIAVLGVPARGVRGQGLRAAVTTVRIVAVKDPEEGEQPRPSWRAWDGSALLPPWARQSNAEVRLSSMPETRQQWYVRAADGKLTLLTTRWTPLASPASLLVRAVSSEPPAALGGALSIRARGPSGDMLTAELPIVWGRSR